MRQPETADELKKAWEQYVARTDNQPQPTPPSVGQMTDAEFEIYKRRIAQ